MLAGNSGTCGGYPKNINQESGQLTSLNYPGLYPDNSNCVWEIRGPEGSTIDITVSVLSIENARQVNKTSMTMMNSFASRCFIVFTCQYQGIFCMRNLIISFC